MFVRYLTVVVAGAVATAVLVLVGCAEPAKIVEVPVTVEVPVEVINEIPVTVEVDREVLNTVEVPVTVEVEREVTREVEVPATVEVPITVEVEIDVTREVEVLREIQVVATRQVWVTREVPVTVVVEKEVVREVPVTVVVEREVVREVPITTVVVEKEVQVEVTRVAESSALEEMTLVDFNDAAVVYDTDGDSQASVYEVCAIFADKPLTAEAHVQLMRTRMASFIEDARAGRGPYYRDTFMTNREFCNWINESAAADS